MGLELTLDSEKKRWPRWPGCLPNAMLGTLRLSGRRCFLAWLLSNLGPGHSLPPHIPGGKRPKSLSQDGDKSNHLGLIPSLLLSPLCQDHLACPAPLQLPCPSTWLRGPGEAGQVPDSRRHDGRCSSAHWIPPLFRTQLNLRHGS